MSATAEAVAVKVAKEVESVKMSDGRTVDFVGKRKLLKDTIIDGSNVSVRLDFRNGETRLFDISNSPISCASPGTALSRNTETRPPAQTT